MVDVVRAVRVDVDVRPPSNGRSPGWRVDHVVALDLTVTTAFSFLGLLPRTDRDKEIEILVSRHRLMVMQRQVRERLVGLPAHSR
ncbi:hypothetical protein [Nonomuraea sp. NPDC001699]